MDRGAPGQERRHTDWRGGGGASRDHSLKDRRPPSRVVDTAGAASRAARQRGVANGIQGQQKAEFASLQTGGENDDKFDEVLLTAEHGTVEADKSVGKTTHNMHSEMQQKYLQSIMNGSHKNTRPMQSPGTAVSQSHMMSRKGHRATADRPVKDRGEPSQEHADRMTSR